ncbi:class I SAM-dependent methyltransferase [Klenkia sp. PcliD-1-E]|uniref:class I SAM-dependent methyltransferase n=1 Tax=Klenkia sp. PcliD-1-E TaxID=2954492 RepID=UPI0020975273|nr:methyltransferase domain-containing protein [Klenkia sp. PcliD-1-E]MCO7218379.1 class I SAM-dependent methyltransferase [Klenkia sp. PcliD-1-E]
MSGLHSAAMQDEFDITATWTEEAVRALGPGHAVPAGCRGSGSVGSLRWLADRLALNPGDLLLDVGSGVGGPAAWVARDRQVRPVCLEPMAGAVRASRHLFGLPSAAAMGRSLPVSSGVAAAAWSLGVLCTTVDKAAVLAELYRVLRSGGRLGLLVFVQVAHVLPTPPPEGNSFPTENALNALLRAASFDVLDQAVAHMDDNPPGWDDAASAVAAEVQRRHGTDPRFERSARQSARMGALLSAGAVRPTLLVAARGSSRGVAANAEPDIPIL